MESSVSREIQLDHMRTSTGNSWCASNQKCGRASIYFVHIPYSHTRTITPPPPPSPPPRWSIGKGIPFMRRPGYSNTWKALFYISQQALFTWIVPCSSLIHCCNRFNSPSSSNDTRSKLADLPSDNFVKAIFEFMGGSIRQHICHHYRCVSWAQTLKHTRLYQ